MTKLDPMVIVPKVQQVCRFIDTLDCHDISEKIVILQSATSVYLNIVGMESLVAQLFNTINKK